ncbi:MAG: UDP-N-acetylmuramoyl-L-alanine--D-glutamate ligase [Proteobacteria bacterium]|nr:UDP-N-acetylmuramoyl-L-alanine--D-glutamate ligase [Pseudomonadota bacterium]MBU1708378.1 UDP-N-acetylmuramoyl-L-alanine--D-glutamate ligase [Pseudomonadota bacterium]
MSKSNNRQTIQSGMKILVVGLGKTGISAVGFLLRQGARITVSEARPEASIDSQTLSFLKESGVELESGGHTDKTFLNTDLIFVSPGIPLETQPLVKALGRGIPVIGELALAPEYLETPVVAVTGTNGKSTVTTLIGDIFKAMGKKVFVGGNIGTPLTNYLYGPQDADVCVLEVSSFQLDTAGDFRPEVGVLLNITPDHLDRYESYQAYGDSKFRLFSGQKQGDWAVLNIADPEILSRVTESLKKRIFFFGKDISRYPGASQKEKRILLTGVKNVPGVEEYDLENTLFAKEPNLQNAMAAILATRLMGCSHEAITKGLDAFLPLNHRLALVAEIDGVRFYDDSKATNIGAVCAALQSFSGGVILIAGGREKGGDYQMLKTMVKARVKSMYLIGEARSSMSREFKDVTAVYAAESLEDAVCQAGAAAKSGDSVLLSPACASFDMFRSYVHRGEVFRAAVAGLVKRKSLEKNTAVNG